MSSAVRGGPEVVPGKHPTAQRLFAETGEIVCDRCGQELDWNPKEFETEDEIRFHKPNPCYWYVCKPCLDAMPDPPLGMFTAVDVDGEEHQVEIG